MSGGSHIVAFGPGDTSPELQSEAVAEAYELSVEVEEVISPEDGYQRSNSHFQWVLPAFAILAVVGWTGFFGWAHHREMLAGATPDAWSTWVAQWAVPTVLVVGLWLLAMRSSRREALRFGETARQLAEESSRLETRLTTVNRELSLAREFLAAQSRDLESVGRVASDRLSENAERMSALVQKNAAQIEAIASVSTTALSNMDKLRDELPVVATSARDVTSQIGNAGRTAKVQLDEMINGLQRMNAFGEAGMKLTEGLKGKVSEALEEFESHARRIGESTSAVIVSLGQRINSLQAECNAFAQSVREGQDDAIGKWEASIQRMRETLAVALREIGEIDAAALEKTRSRLTSVSEWAKQVDASIDQRLASFVEAIEVRKAEHEAREAQEVLTFEKRIAALDSAIAAHQQNQLGQIATLAEQGEKLASKVGKVADQMEETAARGEKVGSALAQAIELLTVRLKNNKDVVEATDHAVVELTDSSVRLLELIQAGAEHSREHLPSALALAEQRLGNFENRTRELGIMLDDAGSKGEALSGYVITAVENSRSVIDELETLHGTMAEHETAHAARIDQLRGAVAALGAESDGVSQQVRGEMTEAVEKLRGALRATLDELGSGHSSAIEELSEKIGTQSTEAIERAIRLRATEAIGELEQAAAHASGVGKEAARQLRDQLAKVDELTGNLESRVARARQRAEEQVDNDFARRVALISESLNSNSIDISKALSNDVTDTAWAAYLRGDRGIFTRRAVRLLDNSEAREIAEIYDRDPDFREHVSRYIHDFEAMLRTLLSTRDGNALGVTLLSSDMGKLYVALAQAIERLRD
ncbi:hypothetical protein SZ64_05080 [Erythrobacter sp. SG61-1L]|uniref:hypothetical protein n=1 Tax=Erythrobacter sp. SG61-1L TaxID=1603897 RepID=UPI0006C8F0B9|nr:hypothetical protein [Erythrobacter sp. SG61-1L]KPL67536.1 hypothetical protein SZ64_05080 [Erythrobacter sp. SG61-1L]